MSDYVLAPGGNVEGSLAGWSLTGGAAAVAGSAPAVTGARLGAKSLLIPNGGSITSAPMCVGTHSPYFRFHARNTAGFGTLKVEVLYLDGPRYPGEREVGYVTAGSTWRRRSASRSPRGSWASTGPARARRRSPSGSPRSAAAGRSTTCTSTRSAASSAAQRCHAEPGGRGPARPRPLRRVRDRPPGRGLPPGALLLSAASPVSRGGPQ